MICLAFALLPEAKPFIQKFSLALFQDSPFRIYQKDSIYAIITGMGKENMTSAISYFSGLFSREKITFINIGFAGHKSHAMGKVFLCEKVLDAASNLSYYPSFFFPWKKATETLCTIEHIESSYPTSMLYDQEGSAFFRTAKSFTELEKIHLLKVISDNEKNPASCWDKAKATSLMKEALIDLSELLEVLHV